VSKHQGSIITFALVAAFSVGGLCAQAPKADNKKKQTAALNSNDIVTDDPAAKVGSDAAATVPAVPVQVLSGYRIGANDELTISVWHEPELSQAMMVRPDGMITLPLLNDIKIAGLTTDGAQALLTEKLKAVVNDPQVTVIVRAVHSRNIFLVGNAAKQGEYPLGDSMTVLELLANAGGVGPFAKTKSIYVLRKEDGKQVRLPFDYKKALSGKGRNPELMPGDMVVVP
jgi:polysaccharide export outer membrane protein